MVDGREPRLFLYFLCPHLSPGRTFGNSISCVESAAAWSDHDHAFFHGAAAAGQSFFPWLRGQGHCGRFFRQPPFCLPSVGHGRGELRPKRDAATCHPLHHRGCRRGLPARQRTSETEGRGGLARPADFGAFLQRSGHCVCGAERGHRPVSLPWFSVLVCRIRPEVSAWTLWPLGDRGGG